MHLAIRTEKLGKIYRSGFLRIPFTGLQDLTMEVPAGTAFGFVGPNGAGKTTTIKTLMGLQAPTSGAAWIHGVPIREPRARERVGFLPERPYFYEHLTAGEFLDFYGRLSAVHEPTRSRRVSELLERVGLERFRNVQLGKYSKGMLQRAGLAQSLVADPDLVVLDEPMSGLDPLGRVLVRDIILEERRKGKTVFFSSHILSDVETICDRVAIVVGGILRGQGTVAELIGQTATEVDCVFLYGGELPEGLVTRRDGDRVELRLPPDQVDTVVDHVRAHGGHIVSIVANTKTLEQVLLDEVERAKPVNTKRLGVLA